MADLNLPDLRTTYLGLALKNPIVPSSTPLSRTLDPVLHLEDANEERQHWRVLEPPELVRDATLRVSADWPGFDASRQAGERYHVTVRKGWLGDFAIMPEALRAAARSGEVVQ